MNRAFVFMASSVASHSCTFDHKAAGSKTRTRLTLQSDGV